MSEKKYFIILPDLGKPKEGIQGFNYWNDHYGFQFALSIDEAKSDSKYFTEQEIKSIDERYWQFAVPVEDGE
ncbi:DUF1642 domain-containing protein [Lactococcus taiwanensis]|uniref:DUF1642 domain-containing protein n=1 Tax=Lactococcus taiwanensis TaxID=1151742 RepID=UPI0019639EE3|nr:DUF1642 domain-containing protein [Lactococcus taiwanensis]QRZ11745.1 DUF1642 domain-containing protein [Lactococcus taiwanensis]